jgi:CoA:oxalate CoA-transferase
MADRGPLARLKVLDFTTMMSGPLGTRMFADMGADVVKVEAPGGDHNRTRTPIRGGMSRFFAQLNTGKRSIVLDLKDAGDRELALQLAAEADVLIENNRPGVMSRLGLGYEDVRGTNPGLVYCSISGYGQTGPSSQSAAYAPNLHAASGFDIAMMRYQAPGSREAPGLTAVFIADVLSAVYATVGIEAALLQRHETGLGQYVDVALFDGMLNMMVFEMQNAQTGNENRRATYGPMPTADGAFVSVAPVSQKQFESLLPLIGRTEWLHDERYATAGGRDERWDELMDAVAEWTKARSVAECLQLLTAAGIACARYRSPEEVLHDPQVAARGVLAPRKDAGGEYFLLNAPFTFADGTVHARGEAPLLDGDRSAVLEDWLGKE